MTTVRTLPQGQTWLIKRMQELSYNQNNVDNGVCYGLVQTALQEILAGEDINDLNDILFTINDISIADFKEVIEEAHQK